MPYNLTLRYKRTHQYQFKTDKPEGMKALVGGKVVTMRDADNQQEVIENYRTIRKSTIALFEKFSEKTLKRAGIASDSPMSVAALGFICCGHQKHHRNVLRERYLKD